MEFPLIGKMLRGQKVVRGLKNMTMEKIRFIIKCKQHVWEYIWGPLKSFFRT